MDKHDQVILRENTILESATQIRYATERDIDVATCSHGDSRALWVARQGMFGTPVAIIGAGSWEKAWSEMLDTLAPVSDDDLHYAYGLDSDLELRVRSRLAADGVLPYPELEGGYHHQGNASGTGVVDCQEVSLHPLTIGECIEQPIERIRLEIRARD